MNHNLFLLFKEMMVSLLNPYGLIVITSVIVIFGYLLYSHFDGGENHPKFIRAILLRLAVVIVIGYLGIWIALYFLESD